MYTDFSLRGDNFESRFWFERSLFFYFFQITFSGDLPIQEGTEGDKIIIFNPNKKKNHRTFNLIDHYKLPTGEVTFDSHKLPSGDVRIDKIIEVDTKSNQKVDPNKVPEVTPKFGICSCCPWSKTTAIKNELVEEEQKPQTEYLTTLPIAVKITEVESELNY